MKEKIEMKKNNQVIRDRYKLNLNIPRTKSRLVLTVLSLMAPRFGTL